MTHRNRWFTYYFNADLPWRTVSHNQMVTLIYWDIYCIKPTRWCWCLWKWCPCTQIFSYAAHWWRTQAVPLLHHKFADCSVNPMPSQSHQFLVNIWRWYSIADSKSTSNILLYIIPIGSMYGIFTNICPIIYDPNVGKYTIHGSYGINYDYHFHHSSSSSDWLGHTAFEILAPRFPSLPFTACTSGWDLHQDEGAQVP